MSDVSGIPYMGPMGQGNFFAPQFSNNPQLSAGQIQSAYMPEFYNNQNVVNNLYGGGANAGFGQLTNYYSALGANQLSGIGSAKPIGFYDNSVVGPYGGNMPGGPISAEQRFMTNGGGYNFPSVPDYSGGSSAPAINWNTIFQSSGGGLGGSPNLNLSDVQTWAGNWNMPSQPSFDRSLFSGGLSGAGYTPQPSSSLDWSTLFGGGGGGGARADPYPGMSMPGGLASPMTAQQPAYDYGSLFKGGDAQADPYPGMAMPGGLSSPMTAQPPAYDYGSLFGQGAGGTGAKPSSVFDTGAAPVIGTQDTGPYGGGAGIGGLDTGRAIGTPYTQAAEPQRGMLQAPVTEAYNPYFNVTGGEGAPPRTEAGTSGALAPGGGLTAADLSEQARARLAEIMGGAKEPSPAEVFAGDKPTPTEGRPGLPDELAGEAGRGGMVGRAAATPDPATDIYPGANPPRPPAEVPFTVERGKEASMRGVQPRLAAAVQGGAQFLPPGYSVEVYSGERFDSPEKKQAFHKGGRAMDVRIIGPDGPIPSEGADNTGMYTLLARGVKTWAAQNDPKLLQPGVGGLGYGGAFETKAGSGVPDLMHHDLGGSRGNLRPEVRSGELPLLTEAERNAMPANIPLLGANQVPLDAPNARSSGEATARAAPPLPAEGPATQTYPGADAPRPPADVPDPRVSGAGFNALDAAAPHTGLELARANMDTPIEKIAMERGGQKAVDQISFMAMGKTPRELAQSYGSMFFSNAEPLFKSLGITRQDFEKAAAMPQTKQDVRMRFAGGFDGAAGPGVDAQDFLRQLQEQSLQPAGGAGAGTAYWDIPKEGTPRYNAEVYEPMSGGFIMRRPEQQTTGGASHYENFPRTGDVEDRRNEVLGRDQLAALKAMSSGIYYADPEPAGAASNPLAAALGLGNIPMSTGPASGMARTRGIADVPEGSSTFDERFSAFDPTTFQSPANDYNTFQRQSGDPQDVTTSEEFTPTRSITERAPSPAAEEMQRRYGGVGNADVGPPQYSGFEQPYGPQYQPGQYMRDQFANHADFTLQDQAERLAGQREHAGAQIAADPELRRNTIATVLAEMGQNQTDAGRLMVIESMLNRLSANENAVNPNYAQGLYKMLGYRNAAGEIDPAGSPIQRSSEGQYYEPFRYGQGGAAPPIIARGYNVMRDHPELAAHVGDLLDAAIKTGTNVSNLATENSSDAMAAAAARTQSPNAWSPIPGSAPELFSRKDLDPRVVPNEHGDPTRYRDWLATLMPPGYQWERQPTSSIPNLPPQWRR